LGFNCVSLLCFIPSRLSWDKKEKHLAELIVLHLGFNHSWLPNRLKKLFEVHLNLHYNAQM